MDAQIPFGKVWRGKRGMTSDSDDDSFPVKKGDALETVKELVAKTDLSSLTRSLVRDHLSNKYGKDFTSFKKELDELTKKAIEENNSSKPETKPIAKPSDSDSDSDVSLVDSGAGRKRGKKRKATASNALSTEDIDNALGKRRAARQASQTIARTAGRGSSRKKKDDSGKPKKDMSGKFGRMTKLCVISDDLQVILGKRFMKRCDVIKELWAYFRQNSLIDPKDGRFGRVEGPLKQVFKSKTRIRLFSMSKELVNHVKDPAMIGGSVAEEALAEQDRLRIEWQKRQQEEAKDDEEEAESREKAKSEKDEEKEEDNVESDSDKEEGSEGDSEDKGEGSDKQDD